MIVFLRSREPYGDSRQEKYYKYYKDNNIDYLFVGWDRKGVLKEEFGQILYSTLYYKSYRIKALLYRAMWFFFVFKVLFKNKNKFNVIHACDLDCALPAVLFKLFYRIIYRKKYFVIFDVFDWYSDTLKSSNILINFLIKISEFISVKISDDIIICEPERRKQIPYLLKKEPVVLRNIPYFNNRSFLVSKDYFNNKMLTVSYVGGLTNHRALNELLDLASKGLINLNIAGYGNINLELRCIELSRLNNVNFFGKVKYEIGLNIMFNSDVIYAMYSLTNANHYFAAPNKFYESLFLGKPIISNVGTIMANKIIKLDTGYIVDDNYKSLKEMINSIEINSHILDLKSNNCLQHWNKTFCSLNKEFFTDTYSVMINK